MSRDLFKWSKIATAYAKYRPTYGKEVFDTIINFCKETNDSLSLAIDVGCGSGQSTIPLAKDFDKVIGIDVSVKQIENAPENLPNVSFRTGLAEDLSFLSDGTVDLVTVAQTLHWLDLKAFFGEVQRILKPGGSLVVYGYGLAVLDNSKALEVQNYIYRDVLGGYWDRGRDKIEEHYSSFSLPFPEWRRNDSFKIERSWTVDEYMGYLSSWSAWHTYLQDHPNSDAMELVRQRMKDVYGYGKEDSLQEKMKIYWPVFMLMGHKPLSALK
ncbi:hypothetical protein C0Q70_07067 [Pomacea canaliculata]|uniref:Methyltransferase type 11 domain-containing protein n=1 Tax=Pomacea canaliculata TaxID=400727 RepID=A0A2T7PE10_POMCA|nr:putative methyltransferase DDB_G0268948 [Pomacea canaliculata]PVD31650.1 hypothetical protein C0Q70_07067 [Pomacea canaliculata]